MDRSPIKLGDAIISYNLEIQDEDLYSRYDVTEQKPDPPDLDASVDPTQKISKLTIV